MKVLVILLNKILCNCRSLALWKNAVVTNIHARDNKWELTNYCPISLLSHLAGGYWTIDSIESHSWALDR